MQVFGFIQEKSEETDRESACNADKDPFDEKTQTKLVPVVECHVGFEELAVQGGTALIFGKHRAFFWKVTRDWEWLVTRDW